MFLTNECPGLCRPRPGHSLGKNIKLYEMKNEKKNTWVFLYIKCGKFELKRNNTCSIQIYIHFLKKSRYDLICVHFHWRKTKRDRKSTLLHLF